MHTFWHVKTINVDQMTEYIIDSIQGMKVVHSIRSVGSMDLNKVLKKILACFCYFCVHVAW